MWFVRILDEPRRPKNLNLSLGRVTKPVYAKKNAPAFTGALSPSLWLEADDVLGLQALRALLDLEFHSLPFV